MKAKNLTENAIKKAKISECKDVLYDPLDFLCISGTSDYILQCFKLIIQNDFQCSFGSLEQQKSPSAISAFHLQSHAVGCLARPTKKFIKTNDLRAGLLSLA